MQRKSFKEIDGGITAPSGFVASAIGCGIKKPSVKRLDLALVSSTVPTVAAGTLTSNKVKAAPVRVCASHLRRADVRAIIVNSGNANACTGPRGIQDAKKMATLAAAELGLRPEQVLPCSTGIIGIPLPMDRMEPQIPELAAGLKRKKNDKDFANAILTSDTHAKSIAIKVPIGSKTIKIGAVAKGAGMIRPNMATMLSFVTTDAAIAKPDLKQIVQSAVEHSFNRISVDGDMSTNDTVLVLANGEAGNRPLKAGSRYGKQFLEALEYVLLKLAKMIVRDGERVTKYVEVNVRGAATQADARKVAEAVANSTLVKCSWNGNDPNWGRVMHAIGYSKARFREETIDIRFCGLLAAKNGLAAKTPLPELKKAVSKRDICVCIDLHMGDAEYSVYTSDLSQEYIAFNASEYDAFLKR